MDLHASWNGAAWRFLTGGDAARPSVAAVVGRDGLETSVSAPRTGLAAADGVAATAAREQSRAAVSSL
jgi:hypothetical protein